MTMGNREIPMMPKTTISKLSFTMGKLPNYQPAGTSEPIQRNAPTML